MLDALPGEVRAGDSQRKDHPADLIACLQRLPMPIPNRTLLQNYLADHGFSNHIAKWTSTNLKPVDGDARCVAAQLEHFLETKNLSHCHNVFWTCWT